MITVFLGAGFSAVGGVPLASELFAYEPTVDKITRQRLVERVQSGWRHWRGTHDGQPEEYLAQLQSYGGKVWLDAQWYVGLLITLAMSDVDQVGLNPTIIRHNINRTTNISSHEAFWTTLFRRTERVSIVTTNYDILAERGLRNRPRVRLPRPGFHYGDGDEELAGRGYPSYAHIQKITASGRVPILKLHGSVSWAVDGSKVIHYHDCRPAIRGDPAIVAPVKTRRSRNSWTACGERRNRPLRVQRSG